MIKRTITETIYEYDKDGNLLKKTVTETHTEEDNMLNWPSYPTNPCNPNEPYITWCGTSGASPNLATTTNKLNRDDRVTDTTTKAVSSSVE